MKKIAAIVIGIGLAALPLPALAEDLQFQLTNGSSQTIAYFYTSPTNTDQWQEDVFGDGVFPAGNTVAISIADGSDQCVYDMKFVTESGSEFIESAIDLCELNGNEYTLTDSE